MDSAGFRPIVDDLRKIFATRLDAIVAYGWQRLGPRPVLVLVRTLDVNDLDVCASHLRSWHKAGHLTPLILTTTDFERSLDAFPIEYGEIILSHELVDGRNPFDGLSIRPEDLRRACEVHVKSYLLHLREDYVEAEGRLQEIAELVRESAPGFITLLRHMARLGGGAADTAQGIAQFAHERMGLDRDVLDDLIALAEGDRLLSVDAVRLFPAYLKNIERLAEVVDGWRTA